MKKLYLTLTPLLLFAQSNVTELTNNENTLNSIEITAQQEDTTQIDFTIQKTNYMPNAPMQTQITTKQALGIAGTNGDPLKALKSFAGIVSTNNDEASDIFIHGSKPRETKFNLNHLPLGYVFHVGGIHSVIAPEATAQIDAYLGGFDVTYGNTMGAVVDISPKYPSGSNKGRVHLGLYDADFSFDTQIGEDTALFLGGRRSYFDLFANRLVDELDQDKNDKSKKLTFSLFPQYYDLNFILTHNVGNNLFSIESITAKDQMKLHSTMAKTKDPIANGKINTNNSFTTTGLRWIYQGDNHESMTLLSNMKTKDKSRFFEEDFYIDATTSTTSIYHETIFELSGHKPLVGFEIKKTNAPVNIKTPHTSSSEDFDPLISDQKILNIRKKINLNTYDAFAQDIWDITQHDHLRYGFRVWKTDFQKFGSGVDPRIAYVHEFDNGLSGSFAIGQYSQMPELTYALDGFGNPLINTFEHSNHYTFNFTKKFDEHSSLVMEPYFKTFKNLSISDDDTIAQAVGKGEAYGLDVTYRKKIDRFNMTLSYTYVKAKRQLNTNSKKQYIFQGDIPHTLQINSAYKFKNNWRLASRFSFNSGRPYTPIVRTQDATINGKNYKRPIYGTPYSKRMPDNYDLDVQVGKTFYYKNDKSLEVAFEFMNLSTFFRKDIESYSYNDNYEKDGEYAGMEFLPAFQLTYRF